MTNEYHRRYKALLQKLIDARQAAGLTQAEAAQLIGKPQSYVSKSELGTRRIDFVELMLFARIYGKSIDYFES
jgi:transcriptional regulator with XRE-family HTH domain